MTPFSGAPKIETYAEESLYEAGDQFVCLSIAIPGNARLHYDDDDDPEPYPVLHMELTLDQASDLVEMIQRTIESAKDVGSQAS